MDDIYFDDDIGFDDDDFDDFDDIGFEAIEGRGLRRFKKAMRGMFAPGSNIRRRRQKAKKMKRAARALRRGNALGRPAFARTAPDGIVAGGQRLGWFPLGTSTIGIGASGTLSAASLTAFQPEKLRIQATVALNDVTIQDLKVGTKSQLMGVGNIPATTYGPDSTDGNWQMDPVPVGQQVFLQVTNSNAAAQDVTAALKGVY